MDTQDIGPWTENDLPTARETPWGRDYGMRGFVARERPFIDDHEASRHGWEARSRWGSRPPREFDKPFQRGGVAVNGHFRRAWAWLKEAFGSRG